MEIYPHYPIRIHGVHGDNFIFSLIYTCLLRAKCNQLVTGIIQFLVVPKYSCNKATEEHKLQKPAGFDLLNPAEHSGYSHTVLPGLRSAHTVYLCVLCGSENKQRLFHCTALTGWFL